MRRPPAALLLLLLALAAAAAPLGAQSPRALVEEAERLLDRDEARALRLVEQALPLLTRPADRALRDRALALRCWAQAGTAEPSALVALAERGLAESGPGADPRARASLRVCRGYGHDGAGNGARATADYDFGVAEGTRLGDPRVVADARLLRGERRYYEGELGGALEDLERAYALYGRMGSRERTRYALNAIANLYADQRVGQYDRALEYYRQILEAHRAAGSERDIATSYYNLGSTLERKGDLAGALAWYRRNLEMERRLGDPDEVAYAQRSIGTVLAKLGRPAEALRWLDPAVAQFQRTGNAERVALARLSRGTARRGAGRTAAALADLDSAGAHFRKAGNARFLERVEDERALALAATGDWQGAFQARTAQVALGRELGEKLREEQTSRLRVQFDTEHKERENRALLRENALRGRALEDAARIRRLQTALIVLAVAALAILVAAARRMRAMALTDELTRLPNRRHLLRLAAERFRAAARAGEPVSVLALDVDHFKQVNDTFGHEAGDRVLRRVAEACLAALRPGDVLGRTGGEEFVAVLPRTGTEAALETAERVREGVERVDWSEVAPGLRVTVSVGAAQRDGADEEFAAVVRRADQSLYHAKESGRNRAAILNC